MEKDFEDESMFRKKGHKDSFVLCARVDGGIMQHMLLLGIHDSSLSFSFYLY